MSAISEFNASVFVTEQLSRQLVNAAQDLAHRCVYECASRYNFDAEEAIRFLCLGTVKLERKSAAKAKVVKSAKVSVPKAAFPLPYNGEFNSSFCYALRQNNGLYTQCTGLRKGEADFCKGCASQMQKTGAEVPEYGTIQQRMAVGVFEYVDPKGRKPVAYTKVMKKYKITKEQVMEEAGKLNISINDVHFVESEESKRGRPKVEKEVKVKGVKGRPKKAKKVLEIEGDDDDLFASLVAQANIEEDEEEEVVMAAKAKKSIKSDDEKDAERLAKEEKRLAAEAVKAEKEAKLAAEKAEKEAKKEKERIARELKKAEEEAAKKAKEEQRLKEKADKEAKLAAEKQAKEEAKSQKAGKTVVSKKEEPKEEEEEADVVKKIEFEGKKYLKSKKTGIIYDYSEYVTNGEQVVVGKWNENTNKIEFAAAEEEEEEYDE